MLILFSDTGGGHRASGRAISAGLAMHGPPLTVRMEDPFSPESSRFVNALTGLYSPIIRRAPILWGGVYHGSNSRAFLEMIFGTLGRLVTPRLETLLDRYRPRMVVSVHPLLNHLTLRVASRRRPQPPLMTVITDMVSFHRGWICPGVDALVAPSPEAAGVCLRLGFPRDRLHVLGLPVDPRFSHAPEDDERLAARRALGLHDERFTLLITGGGEGAGRLGAYAAALMQSRLPVQVLLVAGRNEALRREFEGHGSFPGRVFGFVEDMPLLMAASDAILCKAGPGTIAESLICGLPMALCAYLPGQEAGNVALVTSSGVGAYAPRPREAIDLVRRWIDPDGRPSAEHSESRRRALSLGRPHATRDIAQLVVSMVRD